MEYCCESSAEAELWNTMHAHYRDSGICLSYFYVHIKTSSHTWIVKDAYYVRRPVKNNKAL